MKFKQLILVIGISALSSAGAYLLMDNFSNSKKNSSIQVQQSPVSFVDLKSNKSNSSPDNFVEAAENTVHAVVHVKSIIKMNISSNNNPYFDFFWGESYGRNSSPLIGSGSGVIITKDGYIVTNNHVIEKANEIEITLNNQKNYKATVVGRDPKTDIALLKIDGEDLPFISLANSDNVRVGEWVLAVGNPFNLTSTVTAGIISAVGRDISLLGESGIESFIQTDAVVNPGNSGGALVNTSGDLIGINTAISTHTGSFEGYSFAVPSNIVKKVVEDLIEYGSVQRAYLGVNIVELNSVTAERLGIEQTNGVFVNSISNNGFAEESGLESGDIIVKLGSKEIKTFADLKGYLAAKRPGDVVSVRVLRDGKNKDLSVKLSNQYGTSELKSYDKSDALQVLNAKFEPLSNSEKRRLGVRGGVKVEDVGDGLLKDAGIDDGYIILRIQNQWVNNSDDIQRILEDSDKAVLMEVVNKRGRIDYYAVKLL